MTLGVPRGHVSADEAALWLGRSKHWVLRNKNRIGYVKDGRVVAFSPLNLEKFMQAITVEADRPPTPPPPVPCPAPTPAAAGGFGGRRRKGSR